LKRSSIAIIARLNAAGWEVTSRRRGKRTWWRADKGGRALWAWTLPALEAACAVFELRGHHRPEASSP
jgi:hypothetical protein